MTDHPQIDRLLALSERATAGEWLCQEVSYDVDPGVTIVADNLGGLVGAALPWPTEIDAGDMSRCEDNAAFIVAAVNFVRNDLRALHAKIAELEGERDEARAHAALGTDIPDASPGRFADWPVSELVAQCRMQARDQLDPEYSAFMAAVGLALSAILAERDTLKAAKWGVKHVDTMNDMVAMGLARDEAIAERDAASARVGEMESLLADYRAFAGETAGKCLGLAMSTEHPAPDEVLMGIFEASQALAARARLSRGEGE